MKKIPRIISIDLLRLVATFQMVQGHAVDAVLAEQYRFGAVHAFWIYLRGFTAPAFLFAAGFAYYVTTLWDFEGYKSTKKRRNKRLRRSLLILALGYLMRFPIGLLSSDPAVRAQALDSFALVDILQCIGVSLLILKLLFPSQNDPGKSGRFQRLLR
ncbi:MAG: DUF1624 domain-containing protein [Myxococcales bacterium]|nr:MAG: DUF1624 domain-containing protein [Myxococcales bacterium]